MKIKLCGLRRQEDIEYANEAAPDYVGFVFAQSKRKVSPQEAKTLAEGLNKNIKTVGVFVNEELQTLVYTVLTAGLDVVQLHGDESVEYAVKLKEILPLTEIWRAVRVKTAEDIVNADCYPAEKLVLDAFSPWAYGGTGKKADWGLIEQAREKLTKPFFVAGGLSADNVSEAIAKLQPYGIDVSGGIETDGYKDIRKIRKFLDLLGRNHNE